MSLRPVDEVAADIEAAFRARGATEIKGGEELLSRCPNPDHPDENPSFRWNLAKRVGVCDACNWSGGFSVVAPQLGVALSENGTPGPRPSPKAKLQRRSRPAPYVHWEASSNSKHLFPATLTKDKGDWEREAIYDVRDPADRRFCQKARYELVGSEDDGGKRRKRFLQARNGKLDRA